MKYLLIKILFFFSSFCIAQEFEECPKNYFDEWEVFEEFNSDQLIGTLNFLINNNEINVEIFDCVVSWIMHGKTMDIKSWARLWFPLKCQCCDICTNKERMCNCEKWKKV